MFEDYSHVSLEHARHLEVMRKLESISIAIVALGEATKNLCTAITTINRTVHKIQSENLPAPDSNLPDGGSL